MTSPSPLIVFCTCPDHGSAQQIAQALLDQRLAACVSVLPGVTSYYRWEGEIETGKELQLLIKTTTTAYPALQDAITSVHPYELPEILAVGVNTGLPRYLDWIMENTNQ